MKRLTIEELPYCTDSSALFERIRALGDPVYLDSAAALNRYGRFDILTAKPDIYIQKNNNNHLITNSYNNNLNYFDNIKYALEETLPAVDNPYKIPFIGGAAGFFSYDLGRELESLPSSPTAELSTPAAGVGLYSWAIILDHQQQSCLLVSHPQAKKETLREVRNSLITPPPATGDFHLDATFTADMSKGQYTRAFQKIQDYILAGDCYQINLAQRFSANYHGDPWVAYKQLRQVAAAPFSAYLETEGQAILSLSPERFIEVRDQQVSTSPIKGTMPRGESPASDEQFAQTLLASTKDRAENLMIVDLLRNDLGKSCRAGSIEVEKLFELQSFETVHHLVSTIHGELTTGKHPLDLLADCFPGGSITGAPKKRAMEIIEELEPHPRSVYCGAIGYISCDGQMDTNIAIRTLVCAEEKIHCWAGGGIVADSECEAEYNECLSKVGKLLKALEAN